MFAGCLWHRWPYNHCCVHLGQDLIFKAFRCTDSLCIHEIDHSSLSVTTCASSLQIWEVVARRCRVLAPVSGWGSKCVKKEEGHCDSTAASAYQEKPQALFIWLKEQEDKKGTERGKNWMDVDWEKKKQTKDTIKWCFKRGQISVT